MRGQQVCNCRPTRKRKDFMAIKGAFKLIKSFAAEDMAGG